MRNLSSLTLYRFRQLENTNCERLWRSGVNVFRRHVTSRELSPNAFRIIFAAALQARANRIRPTVVPVALQTDMRHDYYKRQMRFAVGSAPRRRLITRF